MAPVLRLDLRDQRLMLHRILRFQPPSGPRSCTDRNRAALGPAVDCRPFAFSPPVGGSVEALQRVAKTDLSDRDLRAAAAGDSDGPGDVARFRFAVAGLGRYLRWTPVGANDSLYRRLAAGRFRADSCLR